MVTAVISAKTPSRSIQGLVEATEKVRSGIQYNSPAKAALAIKIRCDDKILDAGQTRSNGLDEEPRGPTKPDGSDYAVGDGCASLTVIEHGEILVPELKVKLSEIMIDMKSTGDTGEAYLSLIMYDDREG